MRLKPFDQFIAILLVIAMLALFALVGFLSWMPAPEIEKVLGTAYVYLTVPIWSRVICTVVAALMIFLCVRVLFVRRRREPRQKAETAPEGIMLKSGEHGTSFLTLSAIDAMVKKFVRNNPKVRDCKVEVKPEDEGQNVSLQLNVVLMPDAVIPETCGDLQKTLAEHLQTMTGIIVREVRVTVEDSTEPTTTKQRTVK